MNLSFGQELCSCVGADVITFQKGFEVDVEAENPPPTLVILDDFMEEASQSKDVCAMVTRGSHHRSMSVIITLQNFFYKNCRTLTLNSKYIALFRNPRDLSIMNHLSRQMNGGKQGILQEAYQDATRNNPNSYLLLDLSQNQNDNHRIRSNVFPDESCVVYVNSKFY